MRNWWKTLSAVWAIAVAAQGETFNLVRNGSFEDTDGQGWPTDWVQWPATLSPGATVSTDANIAHSGTRSLRISQSQKSSYSRADQIVPVTPGKRYMISCWIRGEDLDPTSPGGGVRLFIGRDGSGNSFRALEPGQAKGSFPWTRCEIGPVAVDEQTRVTFLPYLHQTSGTVWYDDIEMVEITPDLAARLEQMRVRNLLLQDLSLIERACRAGGDALALGEVSRMRTVVSEAVGLPVDLNRRRGPPFCALQRDAYTILARSLGRRHPGRGLVAWTADPFAAQPHLAPPPESPGEAATVTALRGDVEQVALNLTNTTADDLQATVSWSGAGNLAEIVWREVIPVELRDGILIDDALPRLPLANGQAVVVVPPGMTRQVWLEIHTGSVAGRAVGTLAVRWPGGSANLPLALHVLDLEFPAEWPIRTFCYAYLPTRSLTQDRIAMAAEDLARHHVNAIMPHYWTQGVPSPVLAPDGTLLPAQMDWSAFDAMRAYSGYAQEFVLTLPPARLQTLFNLGAEQLPFGGPVWEQRATAWVRALVLALRQRGLDYGQILWTSVDEPSGSHIDTALTVGKMLRTADPRLRLYSNFYSAASPAAVRRLDPVVDVWAPHLDCLDERYLPICSSRDRALWAYRVQGKGTGAASVRGAFWRLFSTGVTGYSFWTYVDASPDPWTPYDTDRHDYHVVYPGDPAEMIPSKRWEAWREGVEDYTLLWLLGQRPTAAASADPPETVDEHALAEQIGAARARVLNALLHAP